MKKIATWLASGLIVAAAAACSVTVNDGDGGSGGTTGGTGGTGGTRGTGGSTGGSGGTAGSGGTSGSGGTAGATPDGGGGTAGADSGGVMCVTNPNDPACNKCAFNRCLMEHCACNAAATCRGPMLAFYTCISMPNADFAGCSTTFVTNANPDGSGGGLANDVATCMIDECDAICQGLDAGTRNATRSQSLKAAIEALESRRPQ